MTYTNTYNVRGGQFAGRVNAMPRLFECAKMPSPVALMAFVLILGSSVGALSACDDVMPPRSPAIQWSAERKLTWEDFKGSRRPGLVDAASSVVYILPPSVECKDGKVVSDVRVVFEPDDSWVVRAMRDDSLLNHEQGHFDIAELYARKMRQAFAGLASLCEDKKKFTAEATKLTTQILADFKAAEDQYDRDTKGGTDPDKQKEALDNIQKGLDDLKGFKGS